MSERSTHYAKSDLLSRRQREVLERIARGMTNAEIADDLGIGFESVKSHVSEILLKLQVESREQAVAAWRERRGFLPRSRDLARAALGWGWLKFAAGAGVVLAGGAVAAGIALSSSGDGSRTAAGVEAATTAIPVAGEVLSLLKDVDLKLVTDRYEEIPLGESVAGLRGYPGKGGGLVLDIVTRDATDVMSIGKVRPPSLETPGVEPRHAWVSDDTKTILFVTCPGPCTTETFPVSGTGELWRSDDGSLTWRSLGTVPASTLALGLASDGRAVIQYDTGPNATAFALVPGMEPLTPPAGFATPVFVVHPTLGPAWTEERSRLPDELRVVGLSGQAAGYPQPQAEVSPGVVRRMEFGAFLKDGGTLWFASGPGPVTQLFTTTSGGAPNYSTTLDGTLTHFVGLDDGRVLATAQAEWLRPYLSIDPAAATPAGSVVIDFAGGTVTFMATAAYECTGASCLLIPIAASY